MHEAPRARRVARRGRRRLRRGVRGARGARARIAHLNTLHRASASGRCELVVCSSAPHKIARRGREGVGGRERAVHHGEHVERAEHVESGSELELELEVRVRVRVEDEGYFFVARAVLCDR